MTVFRLHAGHNHLNHHLFTMFGTDQSELCPCQTRQQNICCRHAHYMTTSGISSGQCRLLIRQLRAAWTTCSLHAEIQFPFGWWWLFPHLQRFWETVWPLIPCLHFFFFFFGGGSGDQLANTNSTLYARISPQWLSKLRQLWLNVPWQVCELVSG